jgi:hypothetical protein
MTIVAFLIGFSGVPADSHPGNWLTGRCARTAWWTRTSRWRRLATALVICDDEVLEAYQNFFSGEPLSDMAHPHAGSHFKKWQTICRLWGRIRASSIRLYLEKSGS